MCDVINELNNNGVTVDLTKLDELISNLNEEKNSIEFMINKELETPIDFTSPESWAFTLYDNGYYPEELSYEYFKKNRHTNTLYNLMCQYKKILKNIKLVDNIRNQISSDGRLRGIWKLNGSQTKRLSCSKESFS